MLLPYSLQNTQIKADPDTIDLGIGDPQFDLLPLELIRSSAEKSFAQKDPSFLQYGAEKGFPPLREALAKFLCQGYGFDVDPDTLFIITGSSSGLDLVCTLFTRSGDRVFVEEPTYFLALKILSDHGLRPVAIPVDENGIIIDALEEELNRGKPVLLYTIPTYQNPSGSTLSADRREKLVALSAEHGFLVVADEVYHFLNYSSSPPPPLAAYTGLENIISLGSFSKILAPGLRLGWIQSHPKIITRLAGCGLLDSGGGLNPFASALVYPLVKSGELAVNIKNLRRVYLSRIEAMDRSLKKYLPAAAYRRPAGGFFFWVKLPAGLEAETLATRAASYQVAFRSGQRFSSRGGLRDYIRIGFTYYSAGELEEGVRRLGLALEAARG